MPIEDPEPSPGEDAEGPLLVMLCTGNAARSVMAGAMVQSARARLRVVTAGTHVVEHQPMSVRTRHALHAVGVEIPKHRSRQLSEDHLEDADLVVAMASEHVRYVRRRHPEAAARTATIAWLARNLRAGPSPLAARVDAMGLAEVDLEVQGDVEDPAGGTDEDYVSCARQLAELVQALLERVG